MREHIPAQDVAALQVISRVLETNVESATLSDLESVREKSTSGHILLETFSVSHVGLRMYRAINHTIKIGRKEVTFSKQLSAINEELAASEIVKGSTSPREVTAFFSDVRKRFRDACNLAGEELASRSQVSW